MDPVTYNHLWPTSYVALLEGGSHCGDGVSRSISLQGGYCKLGWYIRGVESRLGFSERVGACGGLCLPTNVPGDLGILRDDFWSIVVSYIQAYCFLGLEFGFSTQGEPNAYLSHVFH